MDKIGPLLSALGNAIAKRRMSSDMSQQQLAHAAGVHRSYMSDVERGLRNITLSTLESIAAALNTSSADLLLTAYSIRQSNLAEAESKA